MQGLVSAPQAAEGVTQQEGPVLRGPSPASARRRPPPSPSRLRLLSRRTGSTPSLAAAACAVDGGSARCFACPWLPALAPTPPGAAASASPRRPRRPAPCRVEAQAPHLRGHRCVRWRCLETRHQAGERLQKAVGVPAVLRAPL